MIKRKIIKINRKKCNGCGLCMPNCPEGALQMIDGKATLVSDLFCDGLGACIGHCSQGAISIEERKAEEYDEKKVMKNIIKQGKNTIKAHLHHLKEHGQTKYFNIALQFLKENKMKNPLEEKQMPCGCPGTALKVIDKKTKTQKSANIGLELKQWPVQLTLLPVNALFFNNADLLVSADCVAHAFPNFHQRLLKGRQLVIGCPKLDDVEMYADKLTEILKYNTIKSITVAIMEVPCCRGMQMAVEQAVQRSGKKIISETKIITVDGRMQDG